MTKTQEHLFELLKEVDSICRKYDIEYYLAGGSMIGAVRHGGFLPWDDDADVHMSRENAELFVRAVKEEGLKDREVYMRSPSGDYMNAHWRYENTAVTALMRGLTGSESPQGQFVDIFVNYPLPINEKKRNRCLENFELYVELRAQNGVIDSRRSQNYLKRYFRLKRWEKIVGKEKVLLYLEKKMYRFPEEKAKEWFICSPMPPKRAVPKEWWGKPRYIKFESSEFPVAENVEKLLCYIYGPNWFEVPAYTERDSHVFVLDFELPYSVYTSEFNKYLDIKKFYMDEVGKKEKWFALLRKRNVVNPAGRNLQGICISLEIQNRVEKYGFDLKEMVEQGREEELKQIFAPFFEKMNSSEFRYWGTYIDMPDDYLYAALYFSCFNGNYGLARRVLRMRRERSDRLLSSDLQRLCELCDATERLLSSMYGDRNMEETAQIVEEWRRREPDAVYFMRAKMYLDIYWAGCSDTKLLLRQCDVFLGKYENDGELLKYRGDLLLKENRVPEAEESYEKALCTLKNGYCITEIKEYLKRKQAEA